MRTFGSDPELVLFLEDKPKSAIDYIDGDTNERINIKNHEFYYDNVLAECAVSPAKSKKEFVQNLKECLQIFSGLVSPCKLVAQASVDFPKSELNHQHARTVGCAKDFCAYEMKQKEGPLKEISEGTLRSCGGHIHLGDEFLANDGPEPILAVYMLDLFVGVPSVWLDKDPTSKKRRKLYGHAGRYRVKPYGIEYRSLSNFWVKSPELSELVYDLCMFSLDFVQDGSAWEYWDFNFDNFLESNNLSDAWKCKKYDHLKIIEGINKTSKTKLKKYFDMIKKIIPSDINKRIDECVKKDISNCSLNELWGI